MLAPKTQYATLAPSSAQSPSNAYYSGSQRPATATKVPEGFGYSSPTKSELSEMQDDLTTVRYGNNSRRSSIIAMPEVGLTSSCLGAGMRKR